MKGPWLGKAECLGYSGRCLSPMIDDMVGAHHMFCDVAQGSVGLHASCKKMQGQAAFGGGSMLFQGIASKCYANSAVFNVKQNDTICRAMTSFKRAEKM